MSTDTEVWPDAMRQTAEGEIRADLDPCTGYCHEIGDDDCSRCGSDDFDLLCDDCRFYAGQDAEATDEH